METNIRTETLRIGGMTCVHCQNTIEKKLRGLEGVQKAEVRYGAGTAKVTYDTSRVSSKALVEAVEGLGYTARGDGDVVPAAIYRSLGLLAVIVALYLILESLGVLNWLSPSRLAQTNMGYGMLFVIGLITSVHCVAMCGGINLSQSLPKEAAFESRLSALKPTMAYNFGRVVSYTAVGFAVGALGSVFTFSNAAQGLLKLIAGAFMIVMGLNMLDIFPWLKRIQPRMPRIFARK
ncbi:MAG TPA: sulfite exporter TauE/SafE family protein, partial [Clostridia bacterium]|nr:sulfite exporter TauE/SafE family protein [Clostridia bacterium]